MALIRCKECGREVSDQATACPACGAPVALQAPPAPPARSGCGRAALWIVAIVIGGPIVLFVGSAIIAGVMDASGDNPRQAAPYTGKLRADHGTEYELLNEPSQIGGACEGWNVVSLQKPGDRASGIRTLMCWRDAGDRIEVNTQDGTGRRSDSKSNFKD